MNSTAGGARPPPVDIPQPSFPLRSTTDNENSGDQSSVIKNDGKNVQEGHGVSPVDALEQSKEVTKSADDIGFCDSCRRDAASAAVGSRPGEAVVQVACSSGVGEQEDDNWNGFPPLLTTLNENGRPRFNLVKVSEVGRLRILMVPNERPEVLRSPVRDGQRLQMRLLDVEGSSGEQSPLCGGQDGVGKVE